ncbi:transposable element Tcb2 transposase [Trichonephila clavipes]|nr:transposable element Tcb2 transposase [Trichonephila clavipes]
MVSPNVVYKIGELVENTLMSPNSIGKYGQKVIGDAVQNIEFIYGLINGNRRVVVRFERYPTRQQSNHQTFARVHQSLAEQGSIRAMIGDTPVNSKMDLAARMSIAAVTILETLDIFKHVRQSMPRSGSPRQISRREDRHIIQHTSVEPTDSLTAVHTQAAPSLRVRESSRTIARHLAEGYLTATEWNQVVFSDESRFNLSSDDNRVCVWRPRGSRLNAAFTLQRRTTPVVCVMVWSALAYDTRSALILINGGTIKDVARLTLPHYHPSLACSIPRVFTNRAYLGSFGTASWTAIGLVELEARLQQLWNEISQDITRNLYASVLTRIVLCIYVRGSPTEN